MDIGSLTLLIIASMTVLLMLGVPLAFVSGAIAVVLTVTQFGWNGLFIVGSRTVEFLDSFALIAVPMFVIMASIMEKSGVARDLYRAFHVWAGGLRGGIGVVTTFVAVLLGATTGIIGGEIVLLGLIALPQMLKLGYDKKLAIGTITAGGSLGTMIPPSIILIFYGLTAEVSISHLFVATLLPGLMMALLYITYILIRCGLNPAMGPPLSEEERNIPLREKLALFGGVALPMLVAGGVLVSIYAGFASITESAALGAFGAAVVAWVRGAFSFAMLRDVLVQALRTCGMVFWLVFGTNALIGVYNLMGGIGFAREMLVGLSSEPGVILAVMIGVFILLGFFIDWIGILFLTMPVFLPTLQSLGYDPIWFGVVFNLSMQIAYLTPPFGPACFYLKGAAPEGIDLQDIFAAQWPFIGLQVLALIIVVLWPGLSLWLPQLIYG
ncbi:TRAP transporter large permease [Denitrobaculum tricleocarpae]|uniref:TRAP transporter large permease protein n=1 Tax=Denitrobaculum tricleocarpae TaxID=2591009 RepID=A0A545TMZ0_9PROT|nr:TRAP transporter large permease subunit [Denitrobaculum tricleocarpae]TQV78597.1 TRAP transporter large permease subunit [Denitrobaculum tricleocarpae]